MQPEHNKKLVYSGIDLVGARLQHSLELYEQLQCEIEALMTSSGYLEDAPFRIFGITFRYGLKNDKRYDFYKSKKYNSLDIAGELDMRVLLTADETDPALLKEFFEIATLDCLIHAGRKYKLNIEGLLNRRRQLGDIPEWDPEMDDHPELLLARYKASLSLVH